MSLCWNIRYYDLWHELVGQRYAPERVAIVSLDEATIAAHPSVPLVFWGPSFARAIDACRTAGARLMVLDFLFSVSPEAWLDTLGVGESEQARTYDAAFRSQLKAGNVLLIGMASRKQSGGFDTLLPLPEYLFSLRNAVEDVGLANFAVDSDNVVRTFSPAFAGEDGLTLGPALGPLAAMRAGLRALPQPPPPTPWLRQETRAAVYPIRFAGPSQTFPRVSFQRLLEPHAASDPALRVLDGKIVIFAAEMSGNQDQHLTPYSRFLTQQRGGLMPGAELHANIIETLLRGEHLAPLPVFARSVAVLLLLSVGLFFLQRTSPWGGLGIVVLLAVVWAAGAFLAFRAGRLAPVAAPQAGLLACYLGALGVRLRSEERARRKLRRIFDRYVSPEVVEKILGASQAPRVEGEMLHVTVLFCDIRNFTTMSEKLHPSEVMELLNRWFECACDIVQEHGGMVDKFIGDAIMAVFGAPYRRPDHAQSAIRAALSMAAASHDVADWCAQRFAGRGLPL